MLHIQNLSKQFGSKVLFEGATANISHRSRVALVGPNGAGKSTLIKLILNEDQPDSGMVTRASHLSIGHLPQEIPLMTGRTVLDEVMRLDGRLEGLKEARVELETALSTASHESDSYQADLERYTRVLEELDTLDEFKLEPRARTILSGMGFKEADLERPLSQFSGGWLMRVALARILLMDPDLLLLDEPTNHLDLESLLWLEEFLLKFKGAILVISHDTAFLNRIANTVFEIDQLKLVTYKGNIDAYVTQKQERLEILKSQYASQQSKIAEIEEFVARFGAKATKARQAQSRLKQLEKMDRIELADDRQSMRFKFPPATRSGREVLTLDQACLSYGSKPIFKNLDWVIQRGVRAAIVGVNGAGKTTLLKLLSGTLDVTDGLVKLGHEVRVGYYAQMQSETLDPNKTILQELELSAVDLTRVQVRSLAGSFLFQGDAIDKPCRVLSGGEKARVALAKLLLKRPNFLILDEPTNHLDVESRGVLRDALEDFDGTLCLVSHDREFVSGLVTSVLEIEPSIQGSRVNHLLGTYDDYLAKKIKEAQGRMTQSTSADTQKKPPSNPSTKNAQVSSAPVSDSNSKKGLSNNQRRALDSEREKLEKEISSIEKNAADLRETLGHEEILADEARTIALGQELNQLEMDLFAKLSRWEEVCTLLG